MKKFLLTAACVLGLGFMANAAEITLKASEITGLTATTDITTNTVKGITFAFDKNDGQTAPAYNKNGDIRLYAKNTMAITAPEGVTFEKMEFTLSTQGLKRLTTVTADPGTIATQATGDATVTWSGSTASVVYTIGEKAIYGSDGETKAGQFNWDAVTITYSGTLPEGGDTPVDPDPTPDPDVLTVKNIKEIVALTDGVKLVTDFTLTVGFVNNKNVFVCDAAGDFIQIYGENTLAVGDVIPAGLTGSYKLYNGVTPEIENATIPAATAGTFTPAVVAPADITVALVNNVIMVKNVVLADASPAGKENFTATADGIELSLRNNYTLASVPAGTYDITLLVTIYNEAPSLYVISYNDGGETPVDPDPTPDPEIVTVKSVKEIKALEDGVKFEADFTFTVGWVNAKNVFVCDAAGDFIQIYGTNELKVGDVIAAGLKGSYKLFNDVTPEIENPEIPAATAGTFTPAVVAPADITVELVNSVVLIKDVVLDEASPAGKENFTATADGIELNLRNNYTLESVAPGTYDITVVVTVYQGAPSLYVTNFAAAAGIAGIEAENAPVEYFNLQGVQVANPENGLYIRRQGDKVAKVYVK